MKGDCLLINSTDFRNFNNLFIKSQILKLNITEISENEILNFKEYPILESLTICLNNNNYNYNIKLNVILKKLSLRNINISTLDLTNNILLKSLILFNTNIINLDISDNKYLEQIILDNCFNLHNIILPENSNINITIVSYPISKLDLINQLNLKEIIILILK